MDFLKSPGFSIGRYRLKWNLSSFEGNLAIFGQSADFWSGSFVPKSKIVPLVEINYSKSNI